MLTSAIQPHKPSSGKKNKGKGGGSGGGGSGSGSGAKTPKPSSASHDTVDISKPHWILRIIADSKVAIVVCIVYNSGISTLKYKHLYNQDTYKTTRIIP